MSVIYKVRKMIQIEKPQDLAIKEIAKRYNVSESRVIRKAITNYIDIYTDVIQEPNKDTRQTTFKR